MESRTFCGDSGYPGEGLCVCVYVCECCDLRTSQSCPRLAHELSRTKVAFEPECITGCAGERQTLQPWPAREGGMAGGKEIERTRVMELLKINRVNIGHRRNSSGGRKGHRQNRANKAID